METPLHWLGVAKGKEEVWRQVSARPIQDGFVIDGLHKDAGAITLTSSGNPERYVDCGYITSYVENAQGERTYEFAAATASTEYELMAGRETVSIARGMALDARITVTVMATGDKETRMSATARYVLSRTMLIRNTQNGSQTMSQRRDLASNQRGTFPGTVARRPSGVLEAGVLSAFAP
jgi:hypothetical protein